MGLFDQIENGTAVAAGARRRCGIAIVCDRLEHDDAAQLRRVIAMPAEHASAAGISRALKDAGHVVPPSTVTRHRRRECLCETQ